MLFFCSIVGFPAGFPGQPMVRKCCALVVNLVWNNARFRDCWFEVFQPMVGAVVSTDCCGEEVTIGTILQLVKCTVAVDGTVEEAVKCVRARDRGHGRLYGWFCASCLVQGSCRAEANLHVCYCS